MTDRHDDSITAFDDARPGLLGLAYRLLGSRADAEDAVQDTFLKWQRIDRAAIASAGAWLTTTCTRHCLDLLRNAHRSRVDYVGTWLPGYDAIIVGTPTRYGNMAAQMKNFLDQTGGLWSAALAGLHAEVSP